MGSGGEGDIRSFLWQMVHGMGPSDPVAAEAARLVERLYRLPRHPERRP